jgi:hypothetical protein
MLERNWSDEAGDCAAVSPCTRYFPFLMRRTSKVTIAIVRFPGNKRIEGNRGRVGIRRIVHVAPGRETARWGPTS